MCAHATRACAHTQLVIFIRYCFASSLFYHTRSIDVRFPTFIFWNLKTSDPHCCYYKNTHLSYTTSAATVRPGEGQTAVGPNRTKRFRLLVQPSSLILSLVCSLSPPAGGSVTDCRPVSMAAAQLGHWPLDSPLITGINTETLTFSQIFFKLCCVVLPLCLFVCFFKVTV